MLGDPRTYGLDAVRDAALWYYTLFAFLAVAALARTPELVERWRLVHELDRAHGCWAIEPRDGSSPAGTLLLKPLPDGVGEVEVGWHLHPDSWGRGYATEAARLAPSVTWANDALLEAQSADGDWGAALETIERRSSLGLIDKASARRQRAVLLTAIAVPVALLSGLPVAAMILGLAPGGMLEMSLTAQALELAVPLVLAFHLLRTVLCNLLVGPLHRLVLRPGAPR